MSYFDWIVLLGSLLFIVVYGTYKTKGNNSLNSYLKGDNEAKWWGIGISIMATQASAITFLSTPGQAYTDGMRFIQFYLGLPIAMIVLSVSFIPLYYKLKVFTAYEFLEQRFDLKTRLLAAFLFLVQRGLAAGITIYAPSIILSTLLGWNLTLTNIFIGLLVIIYTVSGGTKAVTVTQKQQMAIMMGGMILAGIMVIAMLPADISFKNALQIAGKMDKLNSINFEFNLNDRYNFWSGITASVFLFMSYFGTDQSQVQRYLSGKSITESRLGLVMNGLLKIPMQFIILFIGVMVYVFYLFNQPPVFFNKVEKEKLMLTEHKSTLIEIEKKYGELFSEKQSKIKEMLYAIEDNDAQKSNTIKTEINLIQEQEEKLKNELKTTIKINNPDAETNDKDYIFMTFVMDYLPVGMVGLLFAVIFSAAMSSTSSELNALASTTVIDFYKRLINTTSDDKTYVKSSKWFTFLWGIFAIFFAVYASLFENLIQAVNILGSLFYGTILGIFLAAFYFKKIKGNAVFYSAIIAELIVIFIHYINTNDIGIPFLKMGYLWYNIVGCFMVIIFGFLIQFIINRFFISKNEMR